MILATIRMAIPSEKRSDILETLKSMARETVVQPGCLGSRLYCDQNDESVLLVEELWRNQDDLDGYLRSEDYRRMLIMVEMASEAPEIRFQTISDSAGLEVIEKARGCRKNEEA